MNNQSNNGSNAPMNPRAHESASRSDMQSQSGAMPTHPTQPTQPAQFNARPSQSAPMGVNGASGRPENSVGTPGGVPGEMPEGANPNPNPAEGEKPKKRPALIAIAIILVVLIASGAFCAWWFLGGGNGFFDSAAVSGQAPYKTQEEITAELNRVVEEGMLNISIASLIEFEDGESEGIAYIENVPSNRYVLKVSIKLDSTGEMVYQSAGLRPDSYIEKIRLTEDLPAGTYPATATFVAYDPDTLEEVGQAFAKVTIQVNS